MDSIVVESLSLAFGPQSASGVSGSRYLQQGLAGLARVSADDVRNTAVALASACYEHAREPERLAFLERLANELIHSHIPGCTADEFLRALTLAVSQHASLVRKARLPASVSLWLCAVCRDALASVSAATRLAVLDLLIAIASPAPGVALTDQSAATARVLSETLQAVLDSASPAAVPLMSLVQVPWCATLLRKHTGTPGPSTDAPSHWLFDNFAHGLNERVRRQVIVQHGWPEALIDTLAVGFLRHSLIWSSSPYSVLRSTTARLVMPTPPHVSVCVALAACQLVPCAHVRALAARFTSDRGISLLARILDPILAALLAPRCEANLSPAELPNLDVAVRMLWTSLADIIQAETEPREAVLLVTELMHRHVARSIYITRAAPHISDARFVESFAHTVSQAIMLFGQRHLGSAERAMRERKREVENLVVHFSAGLGLPLSSQLIESAIQLVQDDSGGGSNVRPEKEAAQRIASLKQYFLEPCELATLWTAELRAGNGLGAVFVPHLTIDWFARAPLRFRLEIVKVLAGLFGWPQPPIKDTVLDLYAVVCLVMPNATVGCEAGRRVIQLASCLVTRSTAAGATSTTATTTTTTTAAAAAAAAASAAAAPASLRPEAAVHVIELVSHRLLRLALRGFAVCLWLQPHLAGLTRDQRSLYRSARALVAKQLALACETDFLESAELAAGCAAASSAMLNAALVFALGRVALTVGTTFSAVFGARAAELLASLAGQCLAASDPALLEPALTDLLPPALVRSLVLACQSAAGTPVHHAVPGRVDLAALWWACWCGDASDEALARAHSDASPAAAENAVALLVARLHGEFVTVPVTDEDAYVRRVLRFLQPLVDVGRADTELVLFALACGTLSRCGIAVLAGMCRHLGASCDRLAGRPRPGPAGCEAHEAELSAWHAVPRSEHSIRFAQAPGQGTELLHCLPVLGPIVTQWVRAELAASDAAAQACADELGAAIDGLYWLFLAHQTPISALRAALHSLHAAPAACASPARAAAVGARLASWYLIGVPQAERRCFTPLFAAAVPPLAPVLTAIDCTAWARTLLARLADCLTLQQADVSDVPLALQMLAVHNSLAAQLTSEFGVATILHWHLGRIEALLLLPHVGADALVSALFEALDDSPRTLGACAALLGALPGVVHTATLANLYLRLRPVVMARGMRDALTRDAALFCHALWRAAPDSLLALLPELLCALRPLPCPATLRALVGLLGPGLARLSLPTAAAGALVELVLGIVDVCETLVDAGDGGACVRDELCDVMPLVGTLALCAGGETRAGHVGRAIQLACAQLPAALAAAVRAELELGEPQGAAVATER